MVCGLCMSLENIIGMLQNGRMARCTSTLSAINGSLHWICSSQWGLNCFFYTFEWMVFSQCKYLQWSSGKDNISLLVTIFRLDAVSQCSWIPNLDGDIQWSELFLLRVYRGEVKQVPIKYPLLFGHSVMHNLCECNVNILFIRGNCLKSFFYCYQWCSANQKCVWHFPALLSTHKLTYEP